MIMPTKKEREDDEATEQTRLDSIQAEQDRQTHLVDPMTHPSSGDPPPAMTDAGERLGAVPMTRNAAADMEQAKQEGLDAAKSDEPTKAEKAQSKHKPAAKRAATKTQTPSKDAGRSKTSEDTTTKAPAQDKTGDDKQSDKAPSSPPWSEPAPTQPVWSPFAPPKDEPKR